VVDYGAKAMSAIASIADSNDEAEIERIMATIPDPTGTFYRYCLPHRCCAERSSRGGTRECLVRLKESPSTPLLAWKATARSRSS
jgi:hypothetical protein